MIVCIFAKKKIEPLDCDENVFTASSSKQSTYTRTITEDTLGYYTFKCMPELGDTLMFNGIDSDTSDMFSYSWYFPSPAQILSGQNTRNPVVIFPVCNYDYEFCSMAFTDSIGETMRVYFNIYKECCDTLELKNQDNLISAFPNPNRGVFKLISKDASVDYSIKVYNLYGQMVYSGSSQNGEAKIDIQGEPVGLYLINLLYNDGRKQTIKVEINYSGAPQLVLVSAKEILGQRVLVGDSRLLCRPLQNVIAEGEARA